MPPSTKRWFADVVERGIRGGQPLFELASSFDRLYEQFYQTLYNR